MKFNLELRGFTVKRVVPYPIGGYEWICENWAQVVKELEIQ